MYRGNQYRTKKFITAHGKKVFRYSSLYKLKRDAKAHAKKMRKSGYMARITKEPALDYNVYIVWILRRSK